jgi:PleD family two-component response regulator
MAQAHSPIRSVAGDITRLVVSRWRGMIQINAPAAKDGALHFIQSRVFNI